MTSSSAQSRSQPTQPEIDHDPATGEMPAPIFLHEEVLEPVITEKPSGRAIIRKRVEQVDRSLEIDLQQQQLSIERRRVDMEIDRAPAPHWDGDTLVVPVLEEEIVVQKRLILREELRVTLESKSIPRVIPTTTRREVVDVIEEPTTSPAS